MCKKLWIQCVVSCITIKYVCNSISYAYRTNKSYFYRQSSKTHKIWGRIDKDIDINRGKGDCNIYNLRLRNYFSHIRYCSVCNINCAKYPSNHGKGKICIAYVGGCTSRLVNWQ